MITKTIELQHGKIEIGKSELGDGLRYYALGDTKEKQEMVAKLLKKFNFNVREKLPVQ